MNKIFKYKLEAADSQELLLPKWSQILTVQAQGEDPYLWAIIDETYVDEKRTIIIFPTGIPMKDIGGLKYISTFQLEQGALVFHVFERNI